MEGEIEICDGVAKFKERSSRGQCVSTHDNGKTVAEGHVCMLPTLLQHLLLGNRLFGSTDPCTISLSRNNQHGRRLG